VKPATADVYRESTFVGRLARTKHGATFEYDDAFLASGAPGIAFRLPRATKRFETAGGLATAETRLVFDRDGRSGLLVTRFDRRAGRRLHQEDACQLLDRYPADK
jgi:hypothetical protein